MDSDARHADGMVHASTRRELLSTRIGAAAPADGCGMDDVGSPKDGALYPTSDQNWSVLNGINYNDYYIRQAGGALPYFVGARVQLGHGLGSCSEV